jgi:hypothetical protein
LTSAYAEHWNGTGWTVTPVPLPSIYPSASQAAQLEGVVTFGPANAWAVGHVDDYSSLSSQTLAYHWTGTAWSRTPTPDPAGASQGNRLFAIAARATNDLWAVGDIGYPEKSIMIHSNGIAWSQVRVPNIGSLQAVAVDQRDVWVAGYDHIAQLNGTRWTQLPIPPLNGSGSLSIAGLSKSPAGLWAVGTDVVPYFDGSLYLPFAAVWNGSAWKVVATPAPSGFTGVTASGTTVWATSADTVTRLSLTGSSLEVTPTGLGGALHAVAADVAGNPWAVGSAVAKTTNIPYIINAPGIRQGGITVATGVSGASVTWIGPVTGSGVTGVSGGFSTGGLPVGTYTVVASYATCSPGIATAAVIAGVATPISARITC